jgi:hypothetical protein
MYLGEKWKKNRMKRKKKREERIYFFFLNPKRTIKTKVSGRIVNPGVLASLSSLSVDSSSAIVQRLK